MSNKDEQATAKENDNKCEWKDCKTCGAINSLKKSSWCFEWLQHLVDFTDLEHLNDKDRQVHLMGNHRDSEMTKIRSKLGNLQQQTVRNIFLFIFHTTMLSSCFRRHSRLGRCLILSTMIQNQWSGARLATIEKISRKEVFKIFAVL